MRTILFLTIIAFGCATCNEIEAAVPLGTTFTYQGQLKASGVPFNGSANMSFKLYDALAGGNLLGTQAINGLQVVDGLFTAELNAASQFGTNAFNGDTRWLEISVSGSTLVPRQPVNATPYALQTRGIFVDDSGRVGLGTKAPHHLLRLSGGPGWTSNFWSGALELDNASAIGWQANASGRHFGIGQTTGGLAFFDSTSDPGTTGSPANSRMVIADNGNIGIGANNPTSRLEIFGQDGLAITGFQPFLTLRDSNTGLRGLIASGHGDLAFHTDSSIGGSAAVTIQNQTGNVGIGTTNPGQRLDVRGNLILDPGANPGIFTGTGPSELNRYLLLINSPQLQTASGLKVGGLLVSDSFSFANPGKNDLIVKGAVGIGTSTPNPATQLNVVTTAAGAEAVLGEAPNGYGVVGTSATPGYGAVVGINSSVNGIGVVGEDNSGIGVQGNGFKYGVYGHTNDGNVGYGGWFDGGVQIVGNLYKSGGSFRIDHPLDPSNEYLSHSFVESPDMMNIYNGNITTDDEGYATITMPDWFEPLNRDFRYQLTILDDADDADFVAAKVVKKVHDNCFTIRTSKPNVEVSWQVTGIRQDAWANAHRIVVEEFKPEHDRGKFLNPEVFGASREMGIGHLPLQTIRSAVGETN